MEGLIADIGLRPIYVGDLDQVTLIDTLTRLWFALAFQQGYGRRLAFKLLRSCFKKWPLKIFFHRFTQISQIICQNFILSEPICALRSLWTFESF